MLRARASFVNGHIAAAMSRDSFSYTPGSFYANEKLVYITCVVIPSSGRERNSLKPGFILIAVTTRQKRKS